MKNAVAVFFFFFAVCYHFLVWGQGAELQMPGSPLKRTGDSVNAKLGKTAGAAKSELVSPGTNISLKSLVNAQLDTLAKSKASIQNKLRFPQDSAIRKRVAAYAGDKLKGAAYPRLRIAKTAPQPFNLSVENGLMYLEESPIKDGSGILNSFTITGKFTLAKIPIGLDLSNNYTSDGGFQPFEGNLFKFHFDREGLQNSLKSDISRFTDFKAIFLKGMDLPEFVGKSVLGKISSIPDAKLISSDPAIISYLKDPDKVTRLFSLDDNELQNELSQMVKLETNKSGYKQAIAKGTDKKVDEVTKAFGSGHTQIATANNYIKQKLIDSISSVLKGIRAQLQENRLDVQKVKLAQKVISGKLSLTDLESQLFQELHRSPGQNKAQSLFSKVRSLQTGAFADQVPGSLANRDIFVKGISLSVKTRQGPASFSFGKQNDVGVSKDVAFENSVFSSPRFLSHISVPAYRSTLGTGKLSWVGSFSSSEDRGMFQSMAMGRNNMTLSVTQVLNLQKMGKITVDVSKSASRYSNTLSPTNDDLLLKESVLSEYLNDNLFETMAVGLNHDFESSRRSMSSNIYFNYAGIGFQNPGNAGGSNMKVRLGGHLKKKFYDNRLAVSIRTDLKNTPVSFSSNSHWQNLQVQFDSRYRVSRALSLNVKYLDNGMKKLGTSNVPVYSSRKFQAGGNMNYKIGGKYSFTNITLAQQQILNPQMTAAGSNFFTGNYMQSIVLKNVSLTANIFYNKEASSIKMIGDMLNSDISLQYEVFDMNLTTSATYLDNQNVARQMGVKQNLQFLSAKHFDINAYADLRKNLIPPRYPDLYAAGRVEFSIKYYLKNKY